jgi:predicted acylesterase/phospholipase RssA
MADRHIAVAMSGGGHRAAAFGLGVMLYLARAGKTAEIASVASVSGGSLANGAIAQDVDLSTAPAQDVEAAIGRAARALTGRGTLFGAGGTVAYLLALPLVGAVLLVGPWLLSLGTVWRVVAVVAGVLLFGWYVGLRGSVAGRAFGKTLFTRDGRRTALDDIHTGVDHVFCATDLHAGEHVYFSGAFVYAYRFGLGTPGGLPLHRAVQASAAFPGAFPVAWIGTGRFGFEGGQPEAAGTHWLALHDGGVYDNMADQWAHGMENRRRRVPDRFQDAGEMVVANASAGLEWGSAWRLALPWLGELITLLRDKSVLYDNGNSVRRQELVARFDLAERESRGLRGALVHIPRSPYWVPRQFENSQGWPERAARAAAAIAHLEAESGESEDEWDAIARTNAAVSTTLFGFSVDVTAQLVRHAYVLAMANLHVILGYPLGPIPSAEEVQALVSPAASDASLS